MQLSPDVVEGFRHDAVAVLRSVLDDRWIERLRRKSPRPEIRLHPETAAAYGITSDDPVRIETPAGAITQHARLTDRVQPGVVYAAYGWWFPEGRPETQYDWQQANFNMLTATRVLGKEFGTPNLKGIGCRIRKVPG